MRRCAECFTEIADKKASCTSCGFNNSKLKAVLGAIKSGRVLDERYYIGRVLGQGGFGITYKGFDIDLDRVIAIKEYYPKNSVQRAEDGLKIEPSNESEFKKGLTYFTDEAKALAKFQGHQNIVSVQNYFRANNTSYMVMEYMEGKTVREILRNGGTMPSGDAVKVILGVLEGLLACHKKNLIHRDLTPDNIYITTNSQVKILDFGSARQTTEGGDNEFTQILKESYAPIEQYQKSGSQGPYTDIYSVGATYYRLLTGKPPPFNATDRIIEDKLKRPSELNPKLKITVEVEDVLMKSMQVKPADRYQNVDDFKNELVKAVNNPKARLAQSSPSSIDTKNKDLIRSEAKVEAKVEVKARAKPVPNPLSHPGPKKKISEKRSIPQSEPKLSKKLDTKDPQDSSESKPLPLVPLAAVAAVVMLVVGYQILNPSTDDPFKNQQKDTLTLNSPLNNNDSLFSIPVSPKTTPKPTPQPTPQPTPKATPKLVIEEPLNDSLKTPENFYSMKVRTFPENLDTEIKILETKEPYSSSQLLVEGKYTIQAWAPGYRMVTQEITELNRNRSIDIDLEKLRTPSITAMNDFYSLVNSPSKEAALNFEKNHQRHAPLKNFYGLVQKDKAVTKDVMRWAKAGDAESNFLLGVLNLEALSEKSDFQQAKNYLQKSYDQGYEPASIWLAKAYSCFNTQRAKGCNDKKSNNLFKEFSYDLPLSEYVQAKIFFQQGKSSNSILKLAESAESAGVYHANHLIGMIAYESNEMKKSKKFFELSANKGNTKSMILLAALAVGNSKKETQSWLLKAYNEGDTEAGIFLAIETAAEDPDGFFKIASAIETKKLSQGYFLKGWAHYKGIGTSQSNKLALENFSKCPDNPNCSSMQHSLEYIKSGGDNLKLKEKALLSLDTNKTRNQMIPDTIGEMKFQLATIYLTSGPKFNPSKAKKYLLEATKFNSNKASEKLCNIWAYGKNREKKDIEKAIPYCEKAYNNNSVDIWTINYLGKAYEEGLGKIKQDNKNAVKVYNQACDLSDGAGCCNLAKVYKLEGLTNESEKSIVRAMQNNFKHCDMIINPK